MSPPLLTGAAWILRISSLACSFGSGISILRSSRPGRSNAGSSVSGRFVAIMSLVLPKESNPSIWLSNCCPKKGLQTPSTDNKMTWKNLHKCSLNFTISTSSLRKSSSSNRIDFVHKNDTGFVVSCVPEHLTHNPGTFSNVFVNDR
jgi:hypothetical protein